MADNLDLYKRLEDLILKTTGGNISEFSRLTNIPHQTIRSWGSRKSSIGHEDIKKICSSTSVSADFLLFGDEKSPIENKPKPESGLCHFPLYLMSSLRHFQFQFDLAPVEDTLPYRPDFRRYPHPDNKKTFATFMEDDSMAPEITRGEILLIDREQKDHCMLIYENVALVYNNDLYIRKLVVNSEMDFFARPINQGFDEIHFPTESDLSSAIIGRVIRHY